MVSRAPKPKVDDDNSLKPKTENAKVGKSKAEKLEKTEKSKRDVKDKEKGDKIKPATGDEAMELIAEYLKAQNRPYSATEVSANLHGKVTKTVADKLLKDMEQNKQIMGKATNGDKKGSQWVFWALQDPNDCATPEELAAMDTEISTLRDTLSGLRATLKIATTKLATLTAAPTSAELTLLVAKLRVENETKRERLEGYKSGREKLVTKEEMERVDKEYRYWAAKRQARKRAFNALEDVFLAGMSRNELWEKAGIEGETNEGLQG